MMRPLPIPEPSASDLSRFWSKVDTSPGPLACWTWTAATNKSNGGYGRFGVGGRADARTYPAHRLAFVWVGGNPDPGELVINHLCRNPACVNPGHLEAVTLVENVMIGVGPSAVASRKTHCPQGHPYAGDNLRTRPDGHRECRECDRLRAARIRRTDRGRAYQREYRRRPEVRERINAAQRRRYRARERSAL